jgi:hypothetical protein
MHWEVRSASTQMVTHPAVHKLFFAFYVANTPFLLPPP